MLWLRQMLTGEWKWCLSWTSLGVSRFLKGFSEIAQPQNFKDLSRCLLAKKAPLWGRCVRVRAGGGQARRGATALRNQQQGEKGARRKAAGGVRSPAAGAGLEEGAETRSGAGCERPECLAEAERERLPGGADSRPGAAHALAGALRSRVPSSSHRPRAQGKEGRGVQPSPERGRAAYQVGLGRSRASGLLRAQESWAVARRNSRSSPSPLLLSSA